MKKLLIVEDEKALREVMVKVLSREFEILTAVDGQAALKTALTEKPDLILLDIVLPLKSGVDVLKELRNDPWGKDALVIVLTNLSDPDTELNVKDFGVAGFYTKANISINGLLSDIKQILK